MNALSYYISDFFDSLKLDADSEGHTFKVMLSGSIKTFLENPTNESAYVVYSMFFDVYRTSYKENRPFVDLLDILRSYEEHTGLFNDGQRDHYIHSVNVFLLGLSIYSRNAAFRKVVEQWNNAPDHQMMFRSHQEEFLFTWGVAALFHDIGYPVEIISKQLQKFITFVADDVNREIGPHVSYLRYDKLNCIDTPLDTSVSSDGFDFKCPTDLLAFFISSTIHADPEKAKHTLDNFLFAMQRGGFVDHGFYSALIVLKWYGEMLIGMQNENVFFNQILPAASAIFLHNAYKNIFQKPPFNSAPLKAEVFPLAFLLIFCDEAQEWNRKAYGSKARTNVMVDDSAIKISETSISLHYITSKGLLTDAFIEKKHALFQRLLDLNSLFPEGLSLSATTQSEQYIAEIKASDILPRPLADSIELIARKIHEDYNAKQLERHPNTPLAYPSWESLPDTLKYSNIRQAHSIGDKLSKIGCCICTAGKEPIYQLTSDEIELLAEYEHEQWVEERTRNGWKYGEEKNTDQKLSPYLLPYQSLTEEIKDLDRDTIRNLEPLLRSIGLAICKIKDRSV